MAAFIANNDKSVLRNTYQNAKVSKIQNLTHGDILAFGQQVLDKNNEGQKDTLNKELERVKDELFKKSQQEQKILLQEAREKADLEMERALNQAKQLQEKFAIEETKRVKAEMTEIAEKQLKEERKIGNERLANMLKKARDRFEEEKMAAVAVARRDEKNIAKEQMNILMKEHEENVIKLKHEAEISKQNAIEEFSLVKEKEKESELEQLKIKMKKETEGRLSMLADKYGKEIDGKLQEIEEQRKEMDALKLEISQQENLHKKSVETLKAVLKSYQDFINSQPGFSEGQADFLLRDFSAYMMDE